MSRKRIGNAHCKDNYLIPLFKDFQETLNYLYSRLPVFQNVGKSAYKADLNNTIALAKAMGNPEKKLRCIHIAGTNGKGSVSSFIASVLTENGYKTGLYTSPHLKDFRERIRINGEMVSEDFVINFTNRIQPIIEEIKPSFFEITFAMSMAYFEEMQVDFAVIETGMGGRLDSTNIIFPLLTVITNVGYDHMEFLGDTLEKIATEKAGIIKPGIPVVIGEFQPETDAIFRHAAEVNISDFYYASDSPESWLEICPLKGNYQKKNLATLNQCLKILKNDAEIALREDLILSGIAHVRELSGIRGRWEILREKPLVIMDTAHNEHGLKYVISQLQELDYMNLHMVIGAVNDKDLSKILPMFPKEAKYYFCKPDIVRGLDAEVLRKTAFKYGLLGNTFPSVRAALDAAKQNADENDVIFAGGSTFVVAEALPD